MLIFTAIIVLLLVSNFILAVLVGRACALGDQKMRDQKISGKGVGE